MPIYMKFEGASHPVPGSGKTAHYAKWVEVEAFHLGQWTVSQGGHGVGPRRDVGRPGDAIFTLTMNASAQALWSNATDGSKMTVLVDFLADGGKPSDLYLSVTMVGTIISGMSVIGPGSDGSSMAKGSLMYDSVTSAYKRKAATP